MRRRFLIAGVLAVGLAILSAALSVMANPSAHQFDPRGGCYGATDNPPVNLCGSSSTYAQQDFSWWQYDLNHDGVVNFPGDTVNHAKCANNTAPFAGCAVGRDKFKQPFSPESIWNMPIGASATYASAGLAAPIGSFVDEEFLFLHPDESEGVRDIYESDCASANTCWNTGVSRCDHGSNVLIQSSIIHPGLHIPDISGNDTPNSPAAILRADGQTIDQTQPIVSCAGDTEYASGYTWAPVDIYGDGITGAHGGSGLSALGGTIRLGELDQSTDVIRHALKIELPADLDFSCSGGCYRWPATNSDCGTSSSCSDYTGSNAQVKPGALLAILPSANCDTGLSLVTTPAKILCHAMQTYGAYIVDNTGWNVLSFNVEHSQEGDVPSQFSTAWGFSISNQSGSDFANDVIRLAAALNVVTNNSSTSVGGGGAFPSGVSWAPPIKN